MTTPPHERTLWDRLSDTSTAKGKRFMSVFDPLNEKLGGALGRLAEQPQDIQGRDKEIEMLHSILERPRTPVALLLGEAGVGKANDSATPVAVNDSRGYVRLGDLTVGDEVFDREGNPTRVLGVFPQGVQEAYRVTFDDGSSVVCNKKHLWTGRAGASHSSGVTAETKTLEDIMNEVNIPLNKWLRPYNSWFIPTNKSVQRAETPLPLDPYVVGALIGDGYMTSPYLCMTSSHLDVARKISDRLGGVEVRKNPASNLWSFYEETDDSHPADVRVSTHICDPSDPTGRFVGQASPHRSIPRPYLYGSHAQRLDLMRGLMDTCGQLGRYQECVFSTTSEQLAHDVSTLAHSLGYRTSIIEQKCARVWDYQVRFLTRRSRHRELFSLPRHLDVIDTYDHGGFRTDDSEIYIRRIEKVEPCDMTCIYVDNPEHLFQIGYEHIVTHNTALVEQFAKDLNAGKLDTRVDNTYLLLSLRLGTLASIGTTRLQTQLSTLLDDLKTLEDAAQEIMQDESIKLVLFMDEIHMLVTIFGPGTKVGGDVIKDVLARSPIRVIGATTRREYDTTIAVDAPLRQRFKQIEMGELDPEIVVKIGQNWWEKVAPDAPMPTEATLRKIIEANAMYRSDSAEPRKSLDILEDLVSYSRRTGKRAGEDEVNDIFKRRYSISLKFEVEADSVYNEIARRVKGQEHALTVLKRLFRSMAFQLDPTSDKPMATALFTGPTGVGKALVNGTFLPTPTGGTTIEKLSVGDAVFGKNGQPTRVVGVYPQGKKRAYRVKFSDGTSLICNDEHKFSYVTAKTRRKKNPSLYTATLRELMNKGITQTYDGSYRRHHKFFIPSNGAVQYEGRGLDVHPYVLGALIGDGALTHKELNIVNDDDFVSDKICSLIDHECSVVPRSYNYSRVFRLHTPRGITKNVQRDWVIKGGAAGLRGVKSPNRFIPESYKQSSIEQRWQLINGLFDTDGTICTTDGGRFNVSFSTNSKQLSEDVAEVLRSLGVWCNVSARNRKDKENTEYRVHVRCSAETKTKIFTLPRHVDAAKRAVEEESRKTRVKKFDWVAIDSVEDLGYEAEMTCIEVDDPDHLYQAGKGFVVTHNTETVKAIANSMYPGENVIQFFNMPDYKTVDHEPAFRKRLGEAVSHTPNSIVLLDELEKAAPEIKDSLLAILDEGIVTYETTTREGLPQMDHTSLRNTIVIATTNAGSDIFANDARFSQREGMGTDIDEEVNNAAVDRLIKDLREDLRKSGGFKPEFLNRFQRIVPYRFLSSDVIIQIAEDKLEDLFAKFKDPRGIEVVHNEPRQWPKDTYDFTTWDLPLYITFVRTNATDSNAGGARAVGREIETMVKDEIVDAVYENPGSTKFKIEVSRDTRLYDLGANRTAGGVIVNALN